MMYLLEYVEVLFEYYGIRHEGLSFKALARKLEILTAIRAEEAARKPWGM